MRKIIAVCFVAFVLASGTSLTAQDAKAPTAQELKAADQEAAVVLSEEEKMVAAENQTPPFLRGLTGKLLMYLPNRLVDLLDVFSLELKGGAAVGAGVRITRAVGLVGEVGATGDLIKGYNRQYGCALTQGYDAQFLIPMAENMDRSLAYGYVNKYWQYGTNFPLPSDTIYLPRTGARDYWAIEVGATCFVGAKAAVHPLAIVDFFAGLILLDPSGDDFVLKPISY